MKIIAGAIALVVAVPGLAGVASAEPEPESDNEPSTSVDTDPLHLVRGQYSLGITHALGHHIALRLEATHDTGSPTWPDDDADRFDVALPIYLDHVLHGPFVAFGLRARSTPQVLFSFSGDDWVPYLGHERAIDATAAVGWQWTFASGLSLTGVATASRTVTNDTGYDQGDYPPVEVAARAGYAW